MLIQSCFCVCIGAQCTMHRYTHKQDWINVRPQDLTILIIQ